MSNAELKAGFAGVEGDVVVQGAVLRYRLAGPSSDKPVIVFENGWSGTFPYAHWLEDALVARGLRVLSYDRAGVGYSRATAPLSLAGITQQLSALLAALGVQQPVVIAGHSYGGLIGVLHAVQAPALVSAIVQIDPTPEFANELIDPTLKLVPAIGRLMQACAALGLDGPLIRELRPTLPPPVLQLINPGRGWLYRSLGGAIDEIRLLWDIRKTVADHGHAANCPRLVISAAPGKAVPLSWLARLLRSEEKDRRFLAAAHGLHQRQAALNERGRWLSLPYSHVGLVVEPDSAAEIAARIRNFIS